MSCHSERSEESPAIPVTARTLLVVILLALVACPLVARVGGGESYSGGSGSSGSGSSGGGGSSGDGEALFYLIRFLFWLTIHHPMIGIPVDIAIIAFFVMRAKKKAANRVLTLSTADSKVAPVADLKALQRFDPNFSEVVFTDFCHSLFARLHRARGERTLANYAPYLGDAAKAQLERMTVGEVKEIVVGSFSVVALRGLNSPTVAVDVEFEANYTEAERRWYVHERWTLERQRDILSPTPDKARAEHCPNCGAPLQTRSDGTCSYCGTRVPKGAFQWYVTNIQQQQKHGRPPSLRSSAPEVGTNSATRYQKNFQQHRAGFQSQHPEFVWEEFEKRVRMIATELQSAWTSRDWERARAFETDAIFQTHRYWMDEYARQKLRNIVDDFRVGTIEAVKITSDAFYDAITVRIAASGFDHTDDEQGNVVAGSKSSRRSWTEYWTLIRGRRQANATTTTPNCPNCGAELKISETGICAFCKGRITSGDFDWVLSRIEQDESYRG